MRGKQNTENDRHQNRYRTHRSDIEKPNTTETGKESSDRGKPGDTEPNDSDHEEFAPETTEAHTGVDDATSAGKQETGNDGAKRTNPPDKSQSDKEQSTEINTDKTQHNRGDSDKEQAGTRAADRHGKAKNLGSFYLGVAAAFLVAALGLSLSTLPIFFSIPLAAVLFGVGIWVLSYASLQPPDKAPESGSGTDRHTTTVVVTAVLLVLQTFIMDVFIFTRMGSVQKYQNPVIIAWILATMVETIAAFALIYRHNPSSTKASQSQDTRERDQEGTRLP